MFLFGKTRVYINAQMDILYIHKNCLNHPNILMLLLLAMGYVQNSRSNGHWYMSSFWTLMETLGKSMLKAKIVPWSFIPSVIFWAPQVAEFVSLMFCCDLDWLWPHLLLAMTSPIWYYSFGFLCGCCLLISEFYLIHAVFGVPCS